MLCVVLQDPTMGNIHTVGPNEALIVSGMLEIKSILFLISYVFSIATIEKLALYIYYEVNIILLNVVECIINRLRTY